MKLTVISYSESKESVDSMGLKSWRKAGVEIELEDSSVEEGYTRAKMAVADALSDYYIQVGSSKNIPTVDQPLPEINPKKTDLLDMINDCTSIEELEKLMNDAFQVGLVNEFIDKKKQLQ